MPVQDFKPLKDLDEGEWRVYISEKLDRYENKFDGINTRLDQTNGKVRAIPAMQEDIRTHGRQINGLWTGIVLIGIPIVIAIIKYCLGI